MLTTYRLEQIWSDIHREYWKFQGIHGRAFWSFLYIDQQVLLWVGVPFGRMWRGDIIFKTPLCSQHTPGIYSLICILLDIKVVSIIILLMTDWTFVSLFEAVRLILTEVAILKSMRRQHKSRKSSQGISRSVLGIFRWAVEAQDCHSRRTWLLDLHSFFPQHDRHKLHWQAESYRDFLRVFLPWRLKCIPIILARQLTSECSYHRRSLHFSTL